MKTASCIRIFKTFWISSLTFSTDSNCKLDSHADTCVLGKNAYIFLDHDQAVDIIGYDRSKGTTVKNMKTISGPLAYDNQATGKMTILAVHQAIHIPTMESNLLCPMQVRMNDVKVDETPKFLTKNPTDIMHAISSKDGDGIKVTIPLSLRGVTSYFPTRKPTEGELNSCPQFDLTYEAPIWDPHSEIFKQQEEALLDNRGMLQEWAHDESRMPQRFISAFDSYLSSSYMQCLDDSTHDLSIVLEDGVNTISSISTKKGKPSVLPYDLAKRWGIGLETAKKTLLHTTKRGLHTAPNPLLSQRYRTNDWMFRYKRLSTDIFTDTMLVRIKSHRGNTCAQIYAHRNTWCKVHPMKTKGEAHHSLSLLFCLREYSRP